MRLPSFRFPCSLQTWIILSKSHGTSSHFWNRPMPFLTMKSAWGLLLLLCCQLAPLVNGQAMACLTVEDCIQYSTLPCQEWIDSMTYWRGPCCSFSDVDDGSENKCKLTIVEHCGWFDSDLACDPTSTTGCVYSGVSIVVEEEGAECPASIYDAFSSDPPSMSPSVAVNPSEPTSPAAVTLGNAADTATSSVATVGWLKVIVASLMFLLMQ